MDDDDLPSLLDPEARGGDIARQGFRFQSELAIARVPFWLTRSSFISMICEALGDVEARFFSSTVGTVREFAEYKNHEVTPAEFWTELERFEELDRAESGAYSRFLLVCPRVSSTIVPVVNALKRLRAALPFYDDAPGLTEQSIADFAKLVEDRGKSYSLARFILSRVAIDSDPPRTVVQGFERFRASLEEHFPIFGALGSGVARSAYSTIATLFEDQIGAVVTRERLLDALWSAAPTHRPSQDITTIKTLTHPQAEMDLQSSILLDWSAFNGGGDRNFPTPDIWNENVVSAINRIAAWQIESGRDRNVLLEGQRRLSASFACGNAFNAVKGFTITMIVKDERWVTNAHATESTPKYAWDEQVVGSASAPAAVAVSIGILRKPHAAVEAFLERSDVKIPLLSLFGDGPITSSEQLNDAVRSAKLRMADWATMFGVREILLFLAVPSQCALFLGHRANGLGRIQCHEWTGTGYVASCAINAS